MEIIFKVMRLNEISWREGRVGEKSQGPASAPAPRGRARKGAARRLDETWGVRCPEAKTSVSGGRELSTASCCWEISQMTTEKQPVGLTTRWPLETLTTKTV